MNPYQRFNLSERAPVPYIKETLNFLEKTDIKIQYPSINHIILREDKTREINMSLVCDLSQNNTLNKNENLKFIIIFSMLDVFADTINPESEGKSFRQKYQNLPKTNDYEIIFSGLYRIAKVIRNAMTHNPNGIEFDDELLSIEYVFKGTFFSLGISKRAFDDFYTLIVMYVKADLGKGEYFLALAREIYSRIVSNITCFSDDLSGGLPLPRGELRIRSARREIIMNPVFEVVDSNLSFTEYNVHYPEWAGADFLVKIDGKKLLIPQEALSLENTIPIAIAKRDWEAIHQFPSVPENL